MSQPRFIDLYYDWMKEESLPSDGLCLSIPDELHGVFENLCPPDEELNLLEADGFDIAFWASEKLKDDSYYECAYQFNPLRQNIVLLCAAINNEL